MRTTFVNTLIELAEKDERIVVLTADLGFSVFEKFAEKFPKRFFNVGISEQNMVGMASGMAMMGKKVYIYSIVPFATMRPFEQIRLDLCYHNLDVKIIGVGGGLAYGPAGATHHAIEDLAIMRSLPNMQVIAPGDPFEAKNAIEESYKTNAPTYIRLSKNNEPIIHNKDEKKYILGKGIKYDNNSDILIISTGNMLEQADKILKELKLKGKNIDMLSIHTMKPFDNEVIIEGIKKYKYIITLEEHNIIGGLYSAVSEVVCNNIEKIEKLKKIIPFAINDTFSHFVGSQEYIKECYGIDAKSVIKKIDELS